MSKDEMLGYMVHKVIKNIYIKFNRYEIPQGSMQDIWSQDIQGCIERTQKILQGQNNISK